VHGRSQRRASVGAARRFIRLSPKTTINLTAGIGLTVDSPDFSLGLNMPLTFSPF
jgi:hypothetical protein